MAHFAFVAFTALAVVGQPTDTAFTDKVAAIKAGGRDCPHCMLVGADLTNQCVKGGNLQGADLDHAKLVLACMSYANFRNTTFRRADLSGANLAHSNLDGADLTGAVLISTSFKGTDLTRARGLTQAQLDAACGDADTKVPAGMTVRICQ
jgi:uncharacterized protein YjbI with pentapeptide repeats